MQFLCYLGWKIINPTCNRWQRNLSLPCHHI